MFRENLKKAFANTYKCSTHDINRFISLLQKGAYPYEYIDYWEKLNETSLPEKNLQSSKQERYFKIKNLGEYHDFYVQSGTSLLSDVFENVWNMRLEIYEIGTAQFLTVPALAWKEALKRPKLN